MSLPDDDDDIEAPRWRRYAPVAGGAALVLLIGFGVMELASGTASAPRKTVPELVHMTVPPTPPPPPPKEVPPEQKMVEQPKMREPETRPDKIVDKPAPKNDAPPPGPLALDAKGAGPGDAFGLGGKPGGTGFGSGGERTGTRFGWYAAILQTRLQEALQKDDAVNQARLDVILKVWLNTDGSPSRVEFTRRSGDPALDGAIQSAILRMARLPQSPPSDMPQPVNLKIDIKPVRQG
jgi:TonB family protein